MSGACETGPGGSDAGDEDNGGCGDAGQGRIPAAASGGGAGGGGRRGHPQLWAGGQPGRCRGLTEEAGLSQDRKCCHLPKYSHARKNRRHGRYSEHRGHRGHRGDGERHRLACRTGLSQDGRPLSCGGTAVATTPAARPAAAAPVIVAGRIALSGHGIGRALPGHTGNARDPVGAGGYVPGSGGSLPVSS
jgi:hypothetical protein